MKNVLILGLLALLLFSVSATLSLWLNPLRPATEENPPATKVAAPKRSPTKDKAHAADDDHDTEPSRPVFRPKSSATGDEAGHLSSQLREQLAALKEREGRLDRRQSQLDLILQDIRTERQALDQLRKQLATELKLLSDSTANVEKRAAEIELQRLAQPKAAEPPKRPPEPDGAEQKNIDRIASTFDTMPAENAARILQQMADSGKLDTAVRLLSQMKERQQAKVLAEISDPGLAAQLVEKLRNLKRATTPNGPIPP